MSSPYHFFLGGGVSVSARDLFLVSTTLHRISHIHQHSRFIIIHTIIAIYLFYETIQNRPREIGTTMQTKKRRKEYSRDDQIGGEEKIYTTITTSSTIHHIIHHHHHHRRQKQNQPTNQPDHTTTTEKRNKTATNEIIKIKKYKLNRPNTFDQYIFYSQSSNLIKWVLCFDNYRAYHYLLWRGRQCV